MSLSIPKNFEASSQSFRIFFQQCINSWLCCCWACTKFICICCVSCCSICIIFIISWCHSSALPSELLFSLLSTQLLSFQFKILIFSLPIVSIKNWTTSEPLLFHFYLHHNLPSSLEFPSNFPSYLSWCRLHFLCLTLLSSFADQITDVPFIISLLLGQNFFYENIQLAPPGIYSGSTLFTCHLLLKYLTWSENEQRAESR